MWIALYSNRSSDAAAPHPPNHWPARTSTIAPAPRHARIAVVATALVAPAASAGAQQLRPYVEHIGGTVVTLEMKPVPGGRVQVATATGTTTVDVAPFWMSSTEIPWDLYDVFAFGLDRPDSAADSVGAVARPTKPYVLPGEQFGHQGHPALAMTFHAAREFARWLSQKTGHAYRLPTEAEWELACRLGRTEPGDRAALAARAWYADNARDRTHPVGALAPNALGLYDLLGNVAEWVTAGGDSVVKGGSYRFDADDTTCGAVRRQSGAWNATDPQLPKSRWWLADAPFVGFRVVRRP